MNKREFVWLIVRLIGVYFVYLTVVTFFTLISSASMLYSMSGGSAPVKPEIESARPPAGFPGIMPEPTPNQSAKLDPAAEKLKSEAFKTLLFYVFLTGLYGGIGFYLVAKGGILFQILSKENSASIRREDQTVTTLKL